MNAVTYTKNQYKWFHDAKVMGKSKIFTEEGRVITPELASYILTLNPPENRDLRKSKIASYANDISSGNFPVTPQNSISISNTGKLLDGQHRLHAICEAKTALQANVSFGYPDSILKHLDRGARRSSADDLKFAGYKNTKALAAISRMVKDFKAEKKSMLNSTELTKFFEEEMDIDLAQKSALIKPWVPIAPTVIRTCFYLISEATSRPERVEEFFEKLVNGNDISIGSAIWALREKAMRGDNFGMSKKSPTEVDLKFCAAIITAWNSWILGKPITGKKAKFEWNQPYKLPTII